MPKPYSQDLRDRVIDAVARGGMSCRAAARRYEISESVAIKWLERYRREGSREPVGHGGHRSSARTPHRAFSGSRPGRQAGRDASGPLQSPLVRTGRQGWHVDDEPVSSPDRRHAEKKTLGCA